MAVLGLFGKSAGRDPGGKGVVMAHIRSDDGHGECSGALKIPKHVALVGDHGKDSARVIRQTLEGFFVDFTVVESIAKLAELQSSRKRTQVAMVLVDSLGSLTNLYEDLRNFRQKYRDVAFLFLSEFWVSYGDTVEQRDIFDVVLRFPVTSGQLVGSLIQAEESRRCW